MKRLLFLLALAVTLTVALRNHEPRTIYIVVGDTSYSEAWSDADLSMAADMKTPTYTWNTPTVDATYGRFSYGDARYIVSSDIWYEEEQ